MLVVVLFLQNWRASLIPLLAVPVSLIGTFAGLFFGIPGLLLGPFVGALIGELTAGSHFNHATNVGIGTWIGLLFGTLAKLALCFTMLGMPMHETSVKLPPLTHT